MPPMVSPPAQKKNDPYIMSEAELAEELTGALLMLSTSSGDKRAIYRDLFLNHDKNPSHDGDPGFASTPRKERHKAGINCWFTDSGALKLPPPKTPEKTGRYSLNLLEKEIQQLEMLKDQDTTDMIRNQLPAAHNIFDPDHVKLVGMTEDSGMQLIFPQDKDTVIERDKYGQRKNCGPVEKEFIDRIVAKLEPMFSKDDREDYLNKEQMYKTGFPGPNFKPLQERLPNGFHTMMEKIYDTAEEMGIKDLRFEQAVNVAFVCPKRKKSQDGVTPAEGVFRKEFRGQGHIISRENYEKLLANDDSLRPVTINSVQVFDENGKPGTKSVDELVDKGLHYISSKKLPADYPRRELTEWLQGLIGKRRSVRREGAERRRDVDVAYVKADFYYDGAELRPNGDGIKVIHDVRTDRTLSRQHELREDPEKHTLSIADAIVLQPIDENRPKDDLYPAKNYALLCKLLIDIETIPEYMRVPLIIDNRSHKFDESLRLLKDATHNGRFPVLQQPFLLAETTEELEGYLEYVKDLVQRSPAYIKRQPGGSDEHVKVPIKTIPNDGKFSVFVGGGHANNTHADLSDAENTGYYCAKMGYRIITGGGTIEGSMGGVHTGFIRYHIEKFLEENHDPQYAKYRLVLEQDKFQTHDGKPDIKKIIEEERHLLNRMADDGIIPKDMFYAYSMKPLLRMESPIKDDDGRPGQQPPGVNYIGEGNRVRRLVGLLASGTKVFLRGGVGTDEEFNDTVMQHLEARLAKKQHGHANNNHFHDGTPDDGAAMIILNKDGHLNKLLSYYNINVQSEDREEKRIAESVCKAHNIVIVKSDEELKYVLSAREKSWRDHVVGSLPAAGGPGQSGKAALQ